MKLTDIKSDKFISLNFKVTSLLDPLQLKEADLGTIRRSQLLDHYELTINGHIVDVEIDDLFSNVELDTQLYRNNANLVEVVFITDKTLQLEILFFFGNVLNLGTVKIGIQEKLFAYTKGKFNVDNIEKLSKQLIDDCVLSTQSEHYICVLLANQETLQSLDKNVGDKKIGEDIKPQLEDHSDNLNFAILGKKYRLPIITKTVVDYSSALKDKEVSKIATKKQLILNAIQPNAQNSYHNYHLMKVDLDFVDAGQKEVLRTLAEGQLNKLIDQNTSYFNVWDEYVRYERDAIIQKAIKIGNIPLIQVESHPLGQKIFVEQDLTSFLKKGDTLILSDRPLIDDFEQISDNDIFDKLNQKGLETIEIKEVRSDSLVLDSALNLKESECLNLCFSIMGEAKQIERRKKARDRVLTGKSANPLLGLLIENGGEIPTPDIPKRTLKLSTHVEKKIFSHGATPTQRKAVELALNTPDIMLIQGPPGTGKTTVITALLEQMNLEQEKKTNITGQVLVSAFQHDAVDNLISRLNVNAIPTVKYGSKDEHTERNFEQISKWVESVGQRIEEKNPEIFKGLSQHQQLEKLVKIYTLSPSKAHTIQLLQYLRSLPRNILDEDDYQLVQRVFQDYQRNDDSTVQISKLGIIRSIRLTERAFKDDGKEQLFKLLADFEEDLSEEQIKHLKQIIREPAEVSKAALDILKGIKRELLQMYQPQLHFEIERPRLDLLDIVARVKDIQDQSTTSYSKKEQILFKFKSELTSNIHKVIHDLGRYNYVFSATVQQAAGNAISEAKKQQDMDTVEYDTVVIDEAARVGAMDLLIPMSQAKKRIILVGDHRQLPHIIEQSIVEKIETETDLENVKENLEQSMFERLFQRLKELERADDIQRTITLDAQYRTHHILGEFASEQFYKGTDLKTGKAFDERYDSPLKEKPELFQQNLPEISGKAAIWLNVPSHSKMDFEQKSGTSKIRKKEAKYIAQYLAEWIDHPEAKPLNFGVISFYKAQINEVYKELEKYGLSIKKEDGWDIHPNYKYLEHEGKIEERLRIGTVDSFQGMEFDIVLLSMVRSSDLKQLCKQDASEKEKRRIFGHLMSKNRLCVSVTRQKKALILVGDSKMVNTPMAQEAIPELSAYYQLCKKDSVGVILDV
ncbi:DEAD/DEAH box helicase [Acinetobacter terrae]|jgi:superfamily I DNA and/or RNA helicase|uniref:AAA family ATPase n=1 Tax=Acinetobacter terrae TaxID=2731247 RepID=A0A8E4F722_9GAMM|nr:AAA domain-containing protein [Acinetobacter terrae]NNH37999.1 AAA family ATPase [Acinetobacter terrae]